MPAHCAKNPNTGQPFTSRFATNIAGVIDAIPFLEGLGYFPIFRGRREMATLIREETAKWAAIIGELNIKLD